MSEADQAGASPTASPPAGRRVGVALRRWGLAVLALGLGAIVLAGIGYRNAIATPIVRHAAFRLAGWPPRRPPLKLLLFADLHVERPETDERRVAAIVDQINALHPDIVIGAGDFVGSRAEKGDYPERALAPLARLSAPLGVYAVLGNHDHVAGSARIAAILARAHIRLLDGRPIEAGPLAIGGLDDYARGWDQYVAGETELYQRMRRLSGARIVVVHRPDQFARIPSDMPLMLAGHTHCGQIVLPLIGPVLTGSDLGRRYACGIIREGGSTLVVTAGLGTSHVPLRFGAPPDMWLLELKGPADAAPAAKKAGGGAGSGNRTRI
ncbi:MAG TPA: metallophosphoesterase [Allosphingosinicella sp.]|nr:metallophosphoesterase [Allosphingosinicella sp.]